MGSNAKRISPAALVLAIICFFLPFVTVCAAVKESQPLAASIWWLRSF